MGLFQPTCSMCSSKLPASPPGPYHPGCRRSGPVWIRTPQRELVRPRSKYIPFVPTTFSKPDNPVRSKDGTPTPHRCETVSTARGVGLAPLETRRRGRTDAGCGRPRLRSLRQGQLQHPSSAKPHCTRAITRYGPDRWPAGRPCCGGRLTCPGESGTARRTRLLWWSWGGV
jgi:hypothetical protein